MKNKYKTCVKRYNELKIEAITKSSFTDWPENFKQICNEIIDTWTETQCKKACYVTDLTGSDCPFCRVYYNRSCHCVEGVIQCRFGDNFGYCDEEKALFKQLRHYEYGLQGIWAQAKKESGIDND